MSIYPTNTGERKRIHIKNLFLDPNNYRFIDNKNYKVVSIENIENEDVQKRTRLFIIEDKRSGVKDLIDSFKANGYLEVDHILVKEFGEKKYQVIDGNRRVAALKELFDDYSKGLDIGSLDKNTFYGLPVIIYNDIENEIVIGLLRTIGNKKWSPYNQALLIYDLVFKYKWSEDKLNNSLGITKHQLRKYLRTISLINDFKRSDYGDKFEIEMFSIFEEIVINQEIKKWLNWDDNTYKPLNQENAEKLYNWLVEIEVDNMSDSIIKKEKIITKSTDVSEVAKFILDQQAINKMESTRSLKDAYLLSGQAGIDKFNNSLEIIAKQIEEANRFSEYAVPESKDIIQKLLNKLQGLAISKGFREIVFSKNKDRETFINCSNNGFSEITINRFKQFENTTIKNLNRINIFAGDNNSGKSSMLELVYLLAKQNDFNAFFEVYRRRGKFSEKLPVNWLKREYNNDYDIIAYFDNKTLKYKSAPFKETSDINDTYYLFSIEINSDFAGEYLYSKAQIFENETKLEAPKIRWVCNASLSSPFSSHNADDIVYCHEKSNEMNTYESIIQFIQNHIDDKIEKITYVGDTNRFLVKHKLFKEPVDLTRFGDGLQRIFYISLQVAASTNGIMCIDELENAIHYTLLTKFVDFLQKLAERFSVQVFITSHSKECIDAFVNNNYKLENISFYQLAETEEGIKFKYASGQTMQKLLSTSKFVDLRGNLKKQEEDE